MRGFSPVRWRVPPRNPILRPMGERTNTDVFIVEDSPAVRDGLSDLLKDLEGVRVVGTADSPGSAIEAILQTRPQCVVLDFQLIGGTAIDVLRGVRPALPDAVVSVLTNYPNPTCRRACIKAGADWFLDKSTEFESIRTIVAGLAPSAALTCTG